MELIDVTALVGGPDERTIVVAHSSTTLDRGLDRGEAVVVRVEDGEFHVARVRDIDFEPEDTVYTLELGGRLPADLAEERIEGLTPERHDLALHEIVDLLSDLRERGGGGGDAAGSAQHRLATT